MLRTLRTRQLVAGTVGLLVVGLVIVAALLTTSGRTHTWERGAKLGEPQKLGSLSVTALGMGESLGSGPNDVPADGNKWLFVLVSVQNLGVTAENVLPDGKVALTDDEGKTYTPRLDTDTRLAFIGAKLEGSLAPGETARGSIAFQVPRDVYSNSLLFNYGDLSDPDHPVWGLP